MEVHGESRVQPYACFMAGEFIDSLSERVKRELHRGKQSGSSGSYGSSSDIWFTLDSVDTYGKPSFRPTM